MTIEKITAAKTTITNAWGDNPPAWVSRLAEACDMESQSKVAKKINRSASLVNMVLKNKYTGSLKDVQDRFEAAYQNSVQCPVLGEIDGTVCLQNQTASFNPGNHVAVRLFKSCKSCPFNVKCKGGGNA